MLVSTARAQAPAGAPVEGSQVPAEAPHSPGFPPFEAGTFAGQLLWFAIAFGALYYVMSKVALPKIGAVLHDRTKRIAADIEGAEAMRAQSEDAVRAHEAALTEARNRAKAIAGETRDKLTAESDARRKALEAELAGKIAASEAALRARTEAAMSNVRGIAADAAAAIVERLTGRAPEPAAVDAALDRALRP